MKPMKHDGAPHTPDRRSAKRYNTDMPHGAPIRVLREEEEEEFMVCDMAHWQLSPV
jgi:hypothetical protein